MDKFRKPTKDISFNAFNAVAVAPAWLRFLDLKPSEFHCAVEVIGLTRATGLCHATNEHLTAVTGLARRTIQRHIKHFSELGIYRVEYDRSDPTETIREIHLTDQAIQAEFKLFVNDHERGVKKTRGDESGAKIEGGGVSKSTSTPCQKGALPIKKQLRNSSLRSETENARGDDDRDDSTLDIFVEAVQLTEKEAEPLIAPTDLVPFTNPDRFPKLMEHHFPDLQKLKHPLTFQQFRALARKFSPAVILETMQALESEKTLTRKYKSAFLTLKKWGDYRNKDGDQAAKNANVLLSAMQRRIERRDEPDEHIVDLTGGE